MKVKGSPEVECPSCFQPSAIALHRLAPVAFSAAPIPAGPFASPGQWPASPGIRLPSPTARSPSAAAPSCAGTTTTPTLPSPKRPSPSRPVDPSNPSAAQPTPEQSLGFCLPVRPLGFPAIGPAPRLTQRLLHNVNIRSLNCALPKRRNDQGCLNIALPRGWSKIARAPWKAWFLAISRPPIGKTAERQRRDRGQTPARRRPKGAKLRSRPYLCGRFGVPPALRDRRGRTAWLADAALPAALLGRAGSGGPLEGGAAAFSDGFPEVGLDGLVDAVEAAGVAVAIHGDPIVRFAGFGRFEETRALRCG